jgi:hypothetical protein
MSAAHQLLKSSRAAQGLPPEVEDERACEQIAMLLNVKSAGDDTRRPSRTLGQSSHAEA